MRCGVLLTALAGSTSAGVRGIKRGISPARAAALARSAGHALRGKDGLPAVPSDTVLCAYEVAPGKACGHTLDQHQSPRPSRERPDGSPEPSHCPMCPCDVTSDDSPCLHGVVPGRQCQTCGGSGIYSAPRAAGLDGTNSACPRCIGGVERIEGGE